MGAPSEPHRPRGGEGAAPRPSRPAGTRRSSPGRGTGSLRAAPLHTAHHRATKSLFPSPSCPPINRQGQRLRKAKKQTVGPRCDRRLTKDVQVANEHTRRRSYVITELQFKATVRYGHTPLRMAKIWNTVVHRWWERGHWGGHRLNILTSCMDPTEMRACVHTKTCPWMLTAALLITAKTWKRPRRPSVDEWVTVGYPHEGLLLGTKE